MCLCFCFVWARGFCPSFLCATCSRQFVLTPPILLPGYWLIFPSCFPSLPSSFAPFIISLCLQFRVGSLPYVGSSDVLCPVQPCPVQPSLVQSSQSVFPLRGSFCLFVCFIILNKSPLTSCIWVLVLFHPLNPDKYICVLLWFRLYFRLSLWQLAEYGYFMIN